MADAQLQPSTTHTVTLPTGRHTFVILPGGDAPSLEKMEEQARAIHEAIRRDLGAAGRNVKTP